MGAAKRLKNGAWEKNRRQRLNLTFLELSKLLPDHDPTLNIPKVEILTKAIAYIKELRQKNANMVECCFNSAMKSEIADLNKQASNLRLRNQQLAELLQRAEISLPGPPAPHPLPFTTPRKWAGKMRKSDVKHTVIEKETTISTKKKSNENKMRPRKKITITTPIKRNLSSSAKPLKEQSPPKSDVEISSTSTPLREIRNVLPVSTSVVVQASGTTPSLVITNSVPKANLVAISKFNLSTAPIMATGFQPVLERNPVLSRLGPGALILPDGRVVSMQAPPPAQIIVMPRIITADTTRTTFVNKLPIPAVSSCLQVRPKAPVTVSLKRKALTVHGDAVNPKKMLANRANQTAKRTTGKVGNRNSPRQKNVKSQVKSTEPAKTSGTTPGEVVNKEKFGSLNDRNAEPLNKSENTHKSENLSNKEIICEKNVNINNLSENLVKIVESSSAGDENQISDSTTNKNYPICNDNLSPEKSPTNRELGKNDLCSNTNDNILSKNTQTLPQPKAVVDCLSADIENNSAARTSETLQIEHHISEIHDRCNQRVDYTLDSISTCNETKISKKKHSIEPLSEFSSEIINRSTVQDAQTINKKASSMIDNASTPDLKCYDKNVGEQQKATRIEFTNITMDIIRDNEPHKVDNSICTPNAINESEKNTANDDVNLNSNSKNTTHGGAGVSAIEVQQSNNRGENSDNIYTNKNNEYLGKESERIALIPQSISNTEEDGQINASDKAISVELPKISKNNKNIQTTCSKEAVTSSNLEKTLDKPSSNECSNNTKNIQHVNVDNPEMMVIQESASNTSLSSSKSTQITTQGNICTENAVKTKSCHSSEPVISIGVKKISTETGEKKSTNHNKSIITDVSSDLTNLFPSDAKLPSCSETLFKDSDRNLFMPLSHSYMDEIRLSLPHGDFSNDLFSSLHVPTGGQHPESLSPTAAFLLSFPLVSTSKASDLIADSEVAESQHATPTTILQIGNIESAGNELYNQTSIMIDNNLTNIQDALKLNRSADNAKNSSNIKQQKDFDPNLSKLHQLEISDFVRNDTYSRNNYRDKKQFLAEADQDLFTSYNKKKPNGKNLDFSLPATDVSNAFQEKFFEFGPNNTRNNLVHNSSEIDTRQGENTNNEKKNQVLHENLVNQQAYIASSQSYSYHTFSNGNDCSMGNSNYLATNRIDNVSSKPPQTMPSYQALHWSSPSVTAASNNMSYLTPYCSHQQKTYTSASNKNVQLKTAQNINEDQRLKEKGPSTGNMLPKFSTNFQFNSNNQSSNQDVPSYTHTNLADQNFKTDLKTKKQKTNSQRAPVNWMTTPDVRSVMADINSGTMLPDAVFQPQKDLEFNSTTNGQNNGVFGSSSNIQPSSVPNNNQSLYQNSHFSAVEMQLDFGTMTDISSTNKPLRSLSSVPNSQQNPHYSWSPSKSSISLLPHIESHMIPSTLPTLVGDLALGTTTPSGPLDNCRTLALPSTPFILDQPSKKFEMKSDAQKQIGRKTSDKECFSERRNNTNRNVQEFCQKTHAHQSTNTTSSFLSVSQLVDHTKPEQNSSRRNSKQSVTKNSSIISKRNMNTQQQEKPNASKISNVNNNHSINYHPANRGPLNQRKPDFPVYQENPPVGFLVHPPPYKGGSYSAESLIGDHNMVPPQEQIPEFPSFSVGNQFPNQFIHNQKPLTSSSEFTQQEFHQTQHTQNSFNYNTHYQVSSYNPENDYHLGVDQFHNFNQSSSTSRNSMSCQTSSHGRDSRGAAHKRAKRREEPQFKCPANHPGTTSLTNFNLSTIFPEINDKRSVQGTNTFHQNVNNKLSEGPLNRSGVNPSLTPQVGMAPHFPPVNLRPH